MATFHTNGRIVIDSLDPNNFAPEDANNTVRNPTNISQVIYGSKIVSSNSTTKSNDPILRSDTSNIHIDNMFQPQTLENITKFKNPENDDRNFVFAAALKGNQADANDDPCIGINNEQPHPDNPCYQCFYGRWMHRNESQPSTCGTYATVFSATKGYTCEYIPYPLPPCYICNEGSGPQYKCKSCQKCDGNRNMCDNQCPGDQVCVDEGCREPCNNNTCNPLQCLQCIYGVCQPTCGEGEDCLLGSCINRECSPACDKSQCQICERDDTGNFSCVSVPPTPLHVCCKGNWIMGPENPSCYTLNDDCEQVDTCPEGSKCYGNECRSDCTTNNNCGACEECNDESCKSTCEYGQTCVNGACITITKETLNCTGCDAPEFNSNSCDGSKTSDRENISCWSCVNSCINASKIAGFPLICKQDDQGRFYCSQYDITTTSLSINFIP